MADEDAFLTTIEQHPTDDTARLVYADWLDERGRPAEAAFLRLEVRLRHHPRGGPGWFALARAFLTAALDTPDDWRERVSRPQLPGTLWRQLDRAGVEQEVVLFHQYGPLAYRFGSVNDGAAYFTDSGTWRQWGARVELVLNDFSVHRGTIRDDRLSLRGRAIKDPQPIYWVWAITRVPDPDCIPDVR